MKLSSTPPLLKHVGVGGYCSQSTFWSICPCPHAHLRRVEWVTWLGKPSREKNAVFLSLFKRRGGGPCFRIRSAEDNFIFYIEYCFFFVPVMKLRWEYNISKQFQSISCLNVWLRAHFPPSKMLIWGKNQHFWHQKPDFTLFHDFSASQPSSSARNEQNITLQLRQNSGETHLVTLIHKNMPKIGCFGAFSQFSCFWGTFFENFEPIICFSIHQMWDEIS